MRTALLTYSGVMIIILLTAIISVITMKSSYSESIAQSLDDSIEYSVKLLQTDRELVNNLATPSNASIGKKKEVTWSDWEDIDSSQDEDGKMTADENFKKDFVGYLTENIDSRINNIEINIYGADAEYGVMSVEVTAEFNYPFGKTDKVISKKTIILDSELKH